MPARPWLLAPDDPPSKQAILDAALRLFVRHGLSGTSIRMIGDEAGYTNPALFKFFRSKDALAVHLFARCYTRLHDRIAAAVDGAEGFGSALDATLDAYLAQLDEDLEAVLFVQDALRELWPKLPAAVRRRSLLRLLADLVRRGEREGAVSGYRSADVPVAAVVGLLAQVARLLYFGELALPARRHRAELRVAIVRVLGGGA